MLSGIKKRREETEKRELRSEDLAQMSEGRAGTASGLDQLECWREE